MKKLFDIILEVAIFITAIMLMIAAYGQTGLEAEIINLQALVMLVIAFQFRGIREREKLGLDNE